METERERVRDTKKEREMKQWGRRKEKKRRKCENAWERERFSPGRGWRMQKTSCENACRTGALRSSFA